MEHRKEILRVLGSSDLLGLLSEQERLLIAAAGRIRLVERGESLYAPGDQATHMYVILSGKVKLSYNTVDGGEVVLDVLQDGRETGAVTLLDEEPVHFLLAMAVEPTRCLSIPRAAFVSAAERHPVVYRRLLTVMRRRIHLDAQAAFLDVRARVAMKLLELADAQTGVVVHISQQELAGLVAASRPNVNRALAQLSRDGIVLVSRETCSILDRTRLSRISRERPRP